MTSEATVVVVLDVDVLDVDVLDVDVLVVEVLVVGMLALVGAVAVVATSMADAAGAVVAESEEHETSNGALATSTNHGARIISWE